YADSKAALIAANMSQWGSEQKDLSALSRWVISNWQSAHESTLHARDFNPHLEGAATAVGQAISPFHLGNVINDQSINYQQAAEAFGPLTSTWKERALYHALRLAEHPHVRRAAGALEIGGNLLFPLDIARAVEEVQDPEKSSLEAGLAVGGATAS